MRKKFEINRTKIKGGCQSVRKVVTHNSKSDFLLGRHIALVKPFKFCYVCAVRHDATLRETRKGNNLGVTFMTSFHFIGY